MYFSSVKEIQMYKPIKDSKPNHWLMSFRLDKKYANQQSKILNYLIKKKIFVRLPGN